MNKKIIQGSIFVLMTVMLSDFFLSGQPVYATGTNAKYNAPENIRAVRNSNTSVRISWKEDTNADGYIIYRYDRFSKKYVQAKVIRDSSVNRWIDGKTADTDLWVVYKAWILSSKPLHDIAESEWGKPLVSCIAVQRFFLWLQL